MCNTLFILENYGVECLEYATWRALGLSVAKAADRAGYSPSTGRNREKEAWWPDLIAAIRASVRSLPPILVPLLPAALDSYKKGEASASDMKIILQLLDSSGAPNDISEIPLLVYERIDYDPNKHGSPLTWYLSALAAKSDLTPQEHRELQAMWKVQDQLLKKTKNAQFRDAEPGENT